MKCIRDFLQAEDGVTAIEYGLLAAGLALILAGLASPLGDSLRVILNKTIDALIAAAK